MAHSWSRAASPASIARLARTSTSARWARLFHQFAEYVRRARDREQLRTLDHASTRDLLETRVREESEKPFWRP
jgi:hypothetical protein